MSDVLLSEQLGAMARVDQLRHQQNEVDEHLSLPQRRAAVAARIREYYQKNGIAFSDAQVDQGVREFFANRLVFAAPPLGLFERLWSTLLLKRRTCLRAVQYLAIAVLVVQCAKVVIHDSERKQQERAVIAAQTAAADYLATQGKFKAHLAAAQQDPSYAQIVRLFPALPPLVTKAEYALANVDTGGMANANQHMAALDQMLDKIKAVQPLVDQLTELERKVADIHLPAQDRKATLAMQSQLAQIRTAITDVRVDSAAGQLRALRATVELIPKEVNIRVVDRAGTPSGVERCYNKALCNDNPGSTQGKSWYLVVEGVDLSGQPVALPTTSSETGTGAWSVQFAVRVPHAEYLKVKADKLDDGHLSNRVVGRKPPGRMEVTYLSSRTTDPLETILEW